MPILAETEGWHRDGLFIYKLHHNGNFRKGKPHLVNKYSVKVDPYWSQGGTTEEAEVIAEALFKALKHLEAAE